MASIAAVRQDYSQPVLSTNNEARASAVTWGAVFAGAFAAGALSLILMALGTGIGLSALSPWPNANASRVGYGAIVWLILVQIIASAVGGYMAGRLRTKWVAVHTHEVYFRDTAHGFLVWAVSLVITSFFFASYATSIAAADRARPVSAAETQSIAGNQYFVDTLFRTDNPRADRNDAPVRSEAALILANALREPEMSMRDKNYLTHLVAASTGLPEAEAERRVAETVAAEREAADNIRKAVAHSLYWIFVALLIGAFTASWAATIGGRLRDQMSLSN
jgi:hypothetical protein